MSDARKRDPRLDAVQTASGAAPSANDESAAGPRVARKAIGILAALLIAFCSWALVIYLQGGDPFEALGGNAPREVAVGSTSTVGSEADSSETNDDESAASENNNGSDADVDTTPSSQHTEGDKKDDSAKSSSSSSTTGAEAADGTSSSSPNNQSPSSNASPAPAQPAQSSEISVSISAGGASSQLTLKRGATVYDALLALGVSVNAENSQYGIYVTSINGIAEDKVKRGGWVYYVNGSEPSMACDRCALSDGDTITWQYVYYGG